MNSRAGLAGLLDSVYPVKPTRRGPGVVIEQNYRGIAPMDGFEQVEELYMVPDTCLLYTSPSPRDGLLSRMPSSA